MDTFDEIKDYTEEDIDKLLDEAYEAIEKANEVLNQEQ